MKKYNKFSNNDKVRLKMVKNGDDLDYFKNDFNPEIRLEVAKQAKLNNSLNDIQILEYLKDDEDINVRKEVAEYYNGIEKLDIIYDYSYKEKQNMKKIYNIILLVDNNIEKLDAFFTRNKAIEYYNEMFENYKNDIINKDNKVNVVLNETYIKGENNEKDTNTKF